MGVCYMIQLKANEAKTLQFDVLVEGIEKKLLQFKFRLQIENVEYGFPCVIEGDKIKVSIPALETILREEKPGIFQCRLEGVGDDKYFLQTWNDSVEIKIEPRVVVKPELPIEESVSPQSLKVKAYLESDKPSVVIEEKKETKKEKKVEKVNKSLRNKFM